MIYEYKHYAIKIQSSYLISTRLESTFKITTSLQDKNQRVKQISEIQAQSISHCSLHLTGSCKVVNSRFNNGEEVEMEERNDSGVKEMIPCKG